MVMAVILEVALVRKIRMQRVAGISVDLVDEHRAEALEHLRGDATRGVHAGQK